MTRDDDLNELAGRYADGRLSAGDLAVLEAAIRDDARFRRWFVRFLHLDAALAGQPGAAVPLMPPGGDSGSAWLASQIRPGQGGWWWRAAAMTAAALLLVLVGTWLPAQVTRTGEVAAALVVSTQARWADPDVELSLRSGDLPPGLLRLEAGSAEFRFQHGATAVLLGPVAVRFTGANALYVQSGQVLCRCPTPESRIILTTPTTQVVDLGTEFAVAVAPDAGNTQVKVLEGAVQIGTGNTTVLRKGESAEVHRDHVLALIPLPASTFDHLLSSATAPSAAAGPNLLRDAGLTGTPANAWRLTEGHAELDTAAGQLLISARGHRFWPSARQVVRQPLKGGELVSASVSGVSPASDPLQERQSAILKLVFIDERGREFAQASRHFLLAGTVDPGQRVDVQVATWAPLGTRAIEVQLMLNARGRSGGCVCFSRPSLVIAPADAGTPAPQPLP